MLVLLTYRALAIKDENDDSILGEYYAEERKWGCEKLENSNVEECAIATTITEP
jgi:hypothetical protein